MYCRLLRAKLQLFLFVIVFTRDSGLLISKMRGSSTASRNYISAMCKYALILCSTYCTYQHRLNEYICFHFSNIVGSELYLWLL